MKGGMLIRRAMLLVAMLAVAGWQVAAQGSDFDVVREPMAILPAEATGLSVIDSQLYCYGSGVLLVAQRSGAHITGFWPDTLLARDAEGATYAVRHPATGDIYLTQTDKHGDSYLYSYRKVGNRRGRLKRVKMNGMTVEHPAFSRDGGIMVFASRDGKLRIGGYDLWYSEWADGEWSRPRNMGKRVNSKYDEVAPTVYGDYLLFASNGHEGELSGYSIYATRLVADHTDGDTVGMRMVGVSPVQKLPPPINGVGRNNSELVVDTTTGCGYWTSDRDGSAPSIYMLSGPLEGVHLWGRVVDRDDASLQGVRVAAMREGREVCSAQTGADGIYSLYLSTGCSYELSFRKDGFFAEQRPLSTDGADGQTLITEMRQDMTLGRLATGQPLQFNDLFEPGVGLELGEQGRNVLAPLVRFLCDNPTTSLSATLYCDATTDSAFNAMLTAKRLQTVERYLRSSVPPSVAISLVNGCGGADGCFSASGIARMVAVLRLGAKNVSKK